MSLISLKKGNKPFKQVDSTLLSFLQKSAFLRLQRRFTPRIDKWPNYRLCEERSEEAIFPLNTFERASYYVINL